MFSLYFFRADLCFLSSIMSGAGNIKNLVAENLKSASDNSSILIPSEGSSIPDVLINLDEFQEKVFVMPKMYKNILIKSSK